MKNKIIYACGIVVVLLAVLIGCTTDNYSLGDLTPPSNIVINTQIMGQDENNPNGDGTGEVVISVTADNATSYKIDFGTSSPVNLVKLNGPVTKKYTATGVNDYTITVVVSGAGGTTSNVTKQISVRSVFNPKQEIVDALTGGSSKTWVIARDLNAHFGVGPWDPNSTTPEYYAAQPNEKADCCQCFYSASFTFSKNETTGKYSLAVSAPDGAFTKTGDLTTLPGIPSSGDEGCYSFANATSEFSFIPSSTGLPASAPSTQTSIDLAGNSTYIGYGAVLKEYEILEISDSYLYLRVQGTETADAWYMKLVPAS